MNNCCYWKKKPYKCTFSILIIDKILYPYFTGFEPLSDCAFFSRKLFSGAFLFLQTFQELWAKQRVCLQSITYKLLQWVACYICVWGFIIIIFVCFSFGNSLHFQKGCLKPCCYECSQSFLILEAQQNQVWLVLELETSGKVALSPWVSSSSVNSITHMLVQYSSYN